MNPAILNPDAALAGQCLKSYTFVCADCTQRATVTEHSLTQAKAASIVRHANGWRRMKRGWVCKGCQTIGYLPTTEAH